MRIAALMMAFLASLLMPGPSHATTDAEFCAEVEAGQPIANRDIGRHSDEVTIYRGMFVMCGLRTVVFRRQILVPVSAFRDGWQDRKQAQWSRTMCEEPAWAAAIRRGWLVTNAVVFADNVRFSSDAACP